MPHANAPLSELGRLRLARCVVDDGWPVRRAAPRSGSRSPRRRRSVGRTATARRAGRGWPTGPVDRSGSRG